MSLTKLSLAGNLLPINRLNNCLAGLEIFPEFFYSDVVPVSRKKFSWIFPDNF
jgi:hypothetical protein